MTLEDIYIDRKHVESTPALDNRGSDHASGPQGLLSDALLASNHQEGESTIAEISKALLEHTTYAQEFNEQELKDDMSRFKDRGRRGGMRK